VVTPPACPADGRWRSHAQFTFADGHVATADATTPCRVPATAGDPPRRPRLALSVAPGRALTGRFTTYRFRVSGPAGCRAGATVRFAHRRVRTNAAGRATLRVRARRPGVRTARTAKAGCGRAIARVRVVAP
jgi:prepilin-type processing-associated H-X9-DG protein